MARIVRRLGSEVAAVGFYGGAIGEGLVAALAQAGVPTLVGRAGETRSCLTILDGGGATTEIREPGPVVEPRSADALLACFIRRVRPGDWVGLSGSLPPGLPPETWGTWIRALKPRVAGAVVDTAGEGLQIALAAGPTLLTPNAAEWRELAMEAPDVAVAVTEGSRGVIWQPARGSRVLWTPSQVPVRNAGRRRRRLRGRLVVAPRAGRGVGVGSPLGRRRSNGQLPHRWGGRYRPRDGVQDKGGRPAGDARESGPIALTKGV